MVDRVYQKNVSESAPAAPADPQVGYPTAGNPAQGVPATVPGPYWFHMITESLRKVITDAGLTPDHTDLDQLAAALGALAPAQNIAVLDTAGVTEWPVPDVLKSGQRKAFAIVKGAGAGGGGTGASGGASSAASAGGGGEGEARCGLLDLTGLDTVTATVGEEGAGAAAGANNGSNGQSSSFGSFITAIGGEGGQGMAVTTASSKVIGGNGGSGGAGGDYAFAGDDGGGGVAASAVAYPTGHGGGSFLAGMTRQPNTTAAGRDAKGYGAGGSGATTNPNGAAQPGGNGTPGVIILRW